MEILWMVFQCVAAIFVVKWGEEIIEDIKGSRKDD